MKALRQRWLGDVEIVKEDVRWFSKKGVEANNCVKYRRRDPLINASDDKGVSI